MEIPLDPEIEAVVRQKVASREYPSVAVLVEEALFLLVQRDWTARQADLNRGTTVATDLDHLLNEGESC